MVLTGREKATIFLSILGADVSSRILRYLPDELADLIAAGINHLPTPSPDALSEVLGEYNGFLALPNADRESLPPAAPGIKKSYGTLLYERPQMISFLLSLMPEEGRSEVLHALPREKATIEALGGSLKHNLFRARLEEKLKEHFSGKLF